MVYDPNAVLGIGHMMTNIVFNISPIPIIMYIILLIGTVYVIGRFGINWALGTMILLFLLNTLVVEVSSTTFSWMFYGLLFLEWVIIVIAFLAFARQGD